MAHPRAERIRRLADNERLASLAGFGWGFAEGLFFFIVPDVYISFAALFSRRAGAVAWLASIAGSVVAVAMVYAIVVGARLDYLGFLLSIPGISGGMLAETRDRLAHGGLPYTPWLVLGGVPLKVYAATAFVLGVGPVPVLLWTVFARIVRIAPAFVAAGAVGMLCRRGIEARPTRWAALLASFWIVFYIFYFTRMARA